MPAKKKQDGGKALAVGQPLQPVAQEALSGFASSVASEQTRMHDERKLENQKNKAARSVQAAPSDQRAYTVVDLISDSESDDGGDLGKRPDFPPLCEGPVDLSRTVGEHLLRLGVLVQKAGKPGLRVPLSLLSGLSPTPSNATLHGRQLHCCLLNH
jgi:hypothetical protein